MKAQLFIHFWWPTKELAALAEGSRATSGSWFMGEPAPGPRDNSCRPGPWWATPTAQPLVHPALVEGACLGAGHLQRLS